MMEHLDHLDLRVQWPPSNTVYAVAHASNGDVWVGTTAGVGSSTDFVDHLRYEQCGAAEQHINALLEDRKGVCGWYRVGWSVTAGERHLDPLYHAEQRPARERGGVLRGGCQGNVWIGTNVGLVRVDGMPPRRRAEEEGPRSPCCRKGSVSIPGR